VPLSYARQVFFRYLGVTFGASTALYTFKVQVQTHRGAKLMDEMKGKLQLLEGMESGDLGHPGTNDPRAALFDSLLSDGYVALKTQPLAVGGVSPVPTYRLTESGRILLATLRAAYQSK
jgi:hypothetical protein